MLLSLFQDNPASESYYAMFHKEHVLARLEAIDTLVRNKKLEELDPKMDKLIPIGMEVDADGRVTRNGYGLFSLSWRSREYPEWPATVKVELDALRAGIKEAHGTRLRFLIWAGMGGAAEDKAMYSAVGLLKRSPGCYILDSTDPAKLKYILEDMVRRSGLRLADTLRSTLVVGLAEGMKSCEPVVNLEKLAALFDKYKVDSRANFIHMSPPGSPLEEFASKRGYRRVEWQLDGANTIACRHSGPLTRGSLYALGLSKVDLAEWIDGACLSEAHIHTAWRLSAFLHAQALAGRDKVTLVLPKPWAGVGAWAKQDFEESLGTSEEMGLKIILESKIKLANYYSPKEPEQDRAFLAVKLRGVPSEGPDKVAVLRRSGYPVASLTLPKRTPLSAYMQFVHYTVFGLAYLRGINFVARPRVDLYASIRSCIHGRAGKVGGVEKSEEWRAMVASPRRVKHRGCVTLYYDGVEMDFGKERLEAPAVYAAIVKRLRAKGVVEYAELTFYGDTRYSPRGRALLKALNRSAECLYRSKMKMPVDIYEGPSTNHSSREMAVGPGKCFSTLILSEKQERLGPAGYTPQDHLAQFLAARVLLGERGRPVVALMVKDLEEASLSSLEDLFRQAGTALKSIKI